MHKCTTEEMVDQKKLGFLSHIYIYSLDFSTIHSQIYITFMGKIFTIGQTKANWGSWWIEDKGFKMYIQSLRRFGNNK